MTSSIKNNKKGNLNPIFLLPLIITGLIYFTYNTYKEPQHITKNLTSSKNKETTSSIGHHSKDKEKDEKNDKPEKFSEYHRLIRTRWGEKEPGYDSNYKLRELKSALLRKSQLKSATVKLDWKERGPGNVSGRARSLIIDPDDRTGNTWFVGSAGGGIWKTTDAGNSWRNLTDNFPNLSVCSMAMASSNYRIIYAGTGEGYSNVDKIGGDGIFKSTDHGETWEQLPSTVSNIDFNYVNRIIIDPSDENHILAACTKSIQKSTDGGISWTKVYNSTSIIQQILCNPSNFSIMYASVNGSKIIKSEDAGNSWVPIFGNITGRVELAISSSNPDVIYAKDESLNVAYSEDAGNTWDLILVEKIKGSSYGEQLFYDNALAVLPTNPNQLLMGAVELYKLTNLERTGNSIDDIQIFDEGTESFMTLISSNQKYFNGSMDINTEKIKQSTIEIKFGPGKSQLAHRFLVPEGRTSGVPDSLYSYADYVQVPFEAWDTKTNRQLMISFRDQDRNGTFNLTLFDDQKLTGREYIWINDVSYSKQPSPQIAKKGGNSYEFFLFTWPVLASGATWSPDKLPDSKLKIESKTFQIRNYSNSVLATGYQYYYPQLSIPYIHPDVHNIQFTQTENGNNRIVITNDGGVAFSDDDGKTWTNPSNGCNTSQFYGVDKHPTKNEYIGGTQDNGSWMSPLEPGKLSEWNEVSGGDGFDAVWNAANPNKVITTVYYNRLYLSEDDGNSVTPIASDIKDRGEGNASFLTQIGYSPQDPDKLYISGLSGVTISEDFGKTWKLTEIPDETWGWYFSSHTEISEADPNIVWAASGMNSQSHVHVSKDGGKSFEATNDFELEMGMLSGLAVHPTEDSTAFAMFSFAGNAKILRTNDFGQNWEDITKFKDGKSTNGFPDVATYCLLVMPHKPNEIWVGTEIGLFISHDNGEHWEYSDNGLPAVSIWEMKIRGTQIILATHGRGVWSVDMPELGENILLNPQLYGAGFGPSGKTNIKYSLIADYDSVKVIVDQQDRYTMPASKASDKIITRAFDFKLKEGVHNIALHAYKNGKIIKSSSSTFYGIEYQECKSSYSNSFDQITNDFIDENNEFTVSPLNLLSSGMALNSPHPYSEGRAYISNLNVPIILSNNESRSTMEYRDIPMVEAGEPNAPFGTVDFYDYVVAEGSTNGIDWIPLLDGYDFNQVKDKAYILGVTIDETPSPKMFVQHHINLLDKFQPNDSLMIRFRLYSDAGATGWGWIIDDVNIQTPPTENRILPKLSNAIYPIPCNDQLIVELKKESSEKVQIAIYDLLGRKVISMTTAYQSRIYINTSQLVPSTYILEINSSGYTERQKIQVTR